MQGAAVMDRAGSHPTIHDRRVWVFFENFEHVKLENPCLLQVKTWIFGSFYKDYYLSLGNTIYGFRF